jgi:hypothetical protein
VAPEEVIVMIIVYGDFNCPYSYLAGQRVDALQRLGHVGLEWRAVEHDPQLSLTGTPSGPDAALWERELAEVASLARPGERPPATIPPLISNTRAAVAAYAEAVSDGVQDAVRRALFDAIWVHGRHLSGGYAVRSIVAELTWPRAAIRQHMVAPDLPMPVDERPGRSFRLFGATVSPDGGPLTTAGYQRIKDWRHHWQALPDRVVPIAVCTDAAGRRTVLPGVAALAHLGRLLDDQDARLASSSTPS